jgi:DNA-binding MarR family transcriptional regulator
MPRYCGGNAGAGPLKLLSKGLSIGLGSIVCSDGARWYMVTTERTNRIVHPGWLTNDSPVLIDTREAADTVRFETFMQLLRTAGALDRAATDALSDLDLTAGAFGALVELAAVGPDGIAPSELARRLAVARRTATLYIDILTRHGWAKREAHPNDKRMVLASLTPEGETLLEEWGGAYRQRLSVLLGDITPLQAERLRQLLALVPLDGTPVDIS